MHLGTVVRQAGAQAHVQPPGMRAPRPCGSITLRAAAISSIYGPAAATPASRVFAFDPRWRPAARCRRCVGNQVSRLTGMQQAHRPRSGHGAWRAQVAPYLATHAAHCGLGQAGSLVKPHASIPHRSKVQPRRVTAGVSCDEADSAGRPAPHRKRAPWAVPGVRRRPPALLLAFTWPSAGGRDARRGWQPDQHGALARAGCRRRGWRRLGAWKPLSGPDGERRAGSTRWARAQVGAVDQHPRALAPEGAGHAGLEPAAAQPQGQAPAHGRHLRFRLVQPGRSGESMLGGRDARGVPGHLHWGCGPGAGSNTVTWWPQVAQHVSQRPPSGG